MRAGVILAGGRSTRFDGADKALAPLAGVPMIRRVADQVASVVDEFVVSCRDDQRDALADALDGVSRVEFAIDAVPDQGPIAGIHAAFQETDAEYALVVGCDMPFVDPGFVEYLFERASGYDAAVPDYDGGLQPTYAVYHTDAMARACRRALDGGDRQAVAPLDDLNVAIVDAADVLAHADPQTFENVNTREELAAAENRLRDDRPR